jgi:hypothetical protein
MVARLQLLQRGRVKVLVNPWAEVLHGGKLLGVTPMDPVSLGAGRQVLTLRNPELGVVKKVVVRVPAGGLVEVRADLLDEAAKARRGR